MPQSKSSWKRCMPLSRKHMNAWGMRKKGNVMMKPGKDRHLPAGKKLHPDNLPRQGMAPFPVWGSLNVFLASGQGLARKHTRISKQKKARNKGLSARMKYSSSSLVFHMEGRGDSG